MSIIDTAKELLKKGIELNDAELVTMANSLLASQGDETTDGQTEPIASPPDKFSEFIMDKSDYSNKYVPVNSITNRVNQFIDDKTEHVDVETPEVPLASRERPHHTLVDQTCSVCKKLFSVSDTHSRDNYLCDQCILGKR